MFQPLKFFGLTDDETSAVEEALTLLAADRTRRTAAFRTALEKVQEATGTLARQAMSDKVFQAARTECQDHPERIVPLSREIAARYPLAYESDFYIVFPDQTRLPFHPALGIAGLASR